ncbi:MAG: hybrid sensor histidine kinase/response regulator [Planctomycetota bacterium]
MTLDPDTLRELLDVFRAELEEHLQVFDQELIAVEKGAGDKDLGTRLKEIMRHAHSLKGAARAVECGEIEKLAHRMETWLTASPESQRPSDEVLAQLYKATDLIRQAWRAREGGGETFDLEKALASLEAGGSPAPGTATPSAPAPAGPSVPPVPPVESPSPAAPVDGRVEQERREENGDRRQGAEDRRKESRRLSDALAVRETIRVDVAKLDGLMAQVQELLVERIRVEQRQDELRRIRERLREIDRDTHELASSISRLARSTGDPEMGSLGKILQGLRERTSSVGRASDVLLSSLASDSLRTALITGDLQEEIRKARMLPVGVLFTHFLRMVRDLAKERSKEVELVTEGIDIELDKQILEALKDPLTHLLRNALDHGIEPPAVRAQKGKPEKGMIKLSAAQRGNSVVVEVSDDGGGIDPEVLRRKAVERRLLDPETAKKVSDAEIGLFIFRPGFSTSPIITDISGRGVGLDVVRENVGKLGGVVDVEGSVDAGTTFRMTLPLTVSTFRGLIIEVARQRFALPLSSVVRALRIESSAVRELGGRHVVLLDTLPIPVVPLSAVLERGPEADGRSADGRISVVVLGMAERRMAFLVDAVIKEEEIIVKSLGPQLPRVRNVGGATIMGDGSVIAILNVPDLIRSAHVLFPERIPIDLRSKAAKTSPTVLVVDDSVTTRTLEKNIMLTAGYKVLIATSAEEAVSILSEKEVDLVVSDVQMPGEDGFALTRRIRREEKWRRLPVILVTSLESDADKTRGIEAGADAYIVKRSFDQANLLETVRQLV